MDAGQVVEENKPGAFFRNPKEERKVVPVTDPVPPGFYPYTA
jgi:hypothetical protein